MRIAALSLALAFALSACGTEAGYRKQLQTWNGAKESTLLSSWGAPDRVYEARDGEKVLTYRTLRNQSVVTETEHSGTSFFGTHHGTTTTTTKTIDWYCETTFKVNRAGVVYDWSYKGNACVG